MTLKETQERFISLISHPNGIQDSIEENSIPAPSTWIDGGKITPDQRCEIYAHAYFARLLEVGSELYPFTFKLLGEADFNNLFAVYIFNHPPNNHNMRSIGFSLHSFVREVFPDNEFLLDLIDFGNNQIRIFDCSTENPLKIEDLSFIAPEKFPETAFIANTNWSIQRTNFDFTSINLGDDSFSESSVKKLDRSTSAILICRPNFEVENKIIKNVDAEILSALNGQNTFSEICELTHQFMQTDIESCATYAAQVIQQAILNNLIRKF